MRYRDLLHQVRRAGDPSTQDKLPNEELAKPDSREAVAKLKLENELREALDKGELRLHFQPLVALSDARLAGFETLLRWENPRHGLMLPATFIPLAEETGLILPICRWALAAAIGFLARFQKASARSPLNASRLVMSLNVTRHQIDDGETMQMLDRIADEYGIAPEQVKFEFTEDALVNDHVRTRSWISDLKQRRIKLSIDDFGTGDLSLGYLHQFDVDELKIDRSFVIEMLTKPRSMQIIRAIIGLAHGLGLNTVAKSIEKPEQAMLLREAGCDYGQGHYFGTPLAESEILARLRADTLSIPF